MEVISNIILNAANIVGVSGQLLLAICSHESGNFKQTYAPADHGSPSYGVCQLKFGSASMVGFKGLPFELMDHKKNAMYAARYLKFQQGRYDDNWVVLSAAYNAGSYIENKKKKGCPKNMGYVRLVQAKLPDDLKSKMDCVGLIEVAEK